MGFIVFPWTSMSFPQKNPEEFLQRLEDAPPDAEALRRICTTIFLSASTNFIYAVTVAMFWPVAKFGNPQSVWETVKLLWTLARPVAVPIVTDVPPWVVSLSVRCWTDTNERCKNV